MNALLLIETTNEGTKCIFLLPKHYTVPPRLSRARPDECALAFNIADQVLSSQEKLCLEEYQLSITNDITRGQNEKIERLHQQHKKELDALENSTLENEKWLKKQIADLEVQLQRASSSQDSIRAQFLEEAVRRVEQQKESDDRLLSHVTADLDRAREQIRELEAKLQNRLSIQNNSTRKGRDGEVTFEDIVKERKGWILTYTGNKPNSGDYQSSIHNIQVRFELKNYTHVVPSKEVEKFRRDLREHPETDLGVFLSLHTTITSIPYIGLEWTPKNQLIVFIPMFLQQDIDLVLQFLDIVIQTVKPYRAILSDNANTEQYPIMKKRIDDALTYARNGIAHLAQMKSQFKSDVKALEDKIVDMTSHTTANLAAQEEQLRSMVAILSAHDIMEDVKEAETDTTQMVDEVKKPSRSRRKVVNTA